ncbi:GGDEF domain-containing protein [Devosia sp.]|uniref:GGDEF domain-containing protein n=1 Tax=Devosia sp. TaxID=1871048 RepID=UPI001A0FBA46|nr:GGDEF domain-containing protein [Devosia sp.]MBE0581322.1 GGDEF domain-containing protein [Devosia sp.]
MSAAAFVLAINLFVAAIFATAFGIVAAYARSAIGARWLALAYGLGIVNPILEFLLPGQADPRPVQVAIFAVFLFALSLCVVGLTRHYRLQPPWRTLGVIVVASLVVNVLIVDMPRSSLLRGILYQAPYFILQVVGVAMILRYRHRKALDVALLVLFAASGLQFLSKPALAAWLGSGASARDYIGSTYAAISQSVGAMLLIANGLLMLLIIVRDAMAEITARSETDTLSSLLNRRGFEDRADRLLATALRAGVPASLVVADLDHFKAINDSHGHEAGDRVITAFADVLRTLADPRAVIGRIGGEEFVAFIPGADLASARLYAEGVRTAFSSLSIAGVRPDRPISASFGVARLTAGDSLSDLLRRADAALYEAKKGGRDSVCVAGPAAPSPPLTATLPPGERRRGSRAAQ